MYSGKKAQHDFPKMRGGGSKAVWNFSKNSSVLVEPSFPYSSIPSQFVTQRVFSAPKKTRHNVGTKKILSNSEEGDGNTKPKIEMTSCQRLGSCENEGTRYKSTLHSKCYHQCAIVQICRSQTLFLVLVLQQMMILGVNCMDLRC